MKKAYNLLLIAVTIALYIKCCSFLTIQVGEIIDSDRHALQLILILCIWIGGLSIFERIYDFLSRLFD